MILLKIGADINIQIDSVCWSETKMLLDLHKKIFFYHKCDKNKLCTQTLTK